jgi:hypothetical protein
MMNDERGMMNEESRPTDFRFIVPHFALIV